MKALLYVFTGGIATTILFLVAFVFYEQNETIRLYKRSILGNREDYQKLQKEYNDYLTKTKNLRSVTVLSKGNDSKHTAIGNLMDTYSNNISGDVSMYYKNLTTDETVMIDADKKYYMASLYKIILTLFILNEIKTGTTQLTDKVGTSSATLEQALNKIITESNNEYALTLAQLYGWKTVEESMKSKLGIDLSFDDNLQSSVKNMGLLFERIALSLNLSDWESTYLLRLLNNQKKISKLPKYLPSHIYSHNKTGEFEEYSHDAGIFYTPKANYILIVMSKTKRPGDTNEQMALMSQKIYEFLNQTSLTGSNISTIKP